MRGAISLPNVRGPPPGMNDPPRGGLPMGRNSFKIIIDKKVVVWLKF